MTTKQIIKPNGVFVPSDDAWHCPDCGYVWGGKNRSPPYPYCPECDNGMLRRCH